MNSVVAVSGSLLSGYEAFSKHGESLAADVITEC